MQGQGHYKEVGERGSDGKNGETERKNKNGRKKDLLDAFQ